MVSLFLVEDEIVMRDGIKKHIQWEKEGIDFVGEASDGELALPMILEKKPDILLTDIKMPFMDGLTLSEKVKRSCRIRRSSSFRGMMSSPMRRRRCGSA